MAFPLILMLSLMGCLGSSDEARAAAILDGAVPSSRVHAEALSGGDINRMRATGLELITIVNCWPDGCR
jgi:hypothetical protein